MLRKPYLNKFSKMNKKLTIVKIGGNVIDSPVRLNETLKAFGLIETPKILVHGGGKKATKLAQKLGIESTFIDGRRVTDKNSLEIATMVYAGLINKEIVSKLQSMHCNALGLSGADLNIIQSKKRDTLPYDFGWVGDVQQIKSSVLEQLLNDQITPVFCAITHNESGELLNTNADSIACELAKSLSTTFETSLIYCFELSGVMENINKPDSVVSSLCPDATKALIGDGKISAGMIPKLDNGFDALHHNVQSVIISNTEYLTNPAAKKTALKLS